MRAALQRERGIKREEGWDLRREAGRAASCRCMRSEVTLARRKVMRGDCGASHRAGPLRNWRRAMRRWLPVPGLRHRWLVRSSGSRRRRARNGALRPGLRGGCGVTARHSIPQVAPASGASTSRRISARASCARRSIAIQFSPRLIRGARKRLRPAFVRRAAHLLSAAGGRGRAATALRRRRPATARSAQRGCGG